LNQALAAWLDGYYHLRVHGGTKEKPKSRLESSSRKPRRVPTAELTDIFLWQEERKADKAGCIKAQGNLYEVDLELAFSSAMIPLISQQFRSGMERSVSRMPCL
jgi:hypothetical protein